MEARTLLSICTFTGLATFCAVSALITKKHDYVFNNDTVEKTVTKAKDSAGYQPKIFIPDTLATWPWPGRINPHHAVVAKESAAWMENFGAFSPRAQRIFNRCIHCHLASLTYPIANKEHFRTCCDFMNLTFFIDEYSDMSEPSEVRKQKDIVMDALRNPHKPRPKEEWVGGEVARQFWEFAIQNASKQSQKRFIQTFDEYLEAVVQQAIDRSGDRVRDIKSYIDIRRDTNGAKSALVLLELALDIPDNVISHPAIQEMALATIDMIVVDNDVASYNVEQSRGDDSHNVIRIVMNELGTDVNGAMLWAQDFHTKLEQKFQAAMAALPEWDEPLNSQVKEYCDGLGQWVRGYYDWQFESERYFGNKGADIKEKRWMALLPKRHKNDIPEVGPVPVDSSLL